MRVLKKIGIKKSQTLRIHASVEQSRSNGPGQRAVIWLQGCSIRCPGCFNRDLWDPAGGRIISVGNLFSWLTSISDIEGLTVSGGEPTEQMPGLLNLLEKVRRQTEISIVLFSGRTLEEILRLPGGKKLVHLLDVLVDGQYDVNLQNPLGVWPSSSNQKIHFFSPRYSSADFANLPFYEAWITEKGDVIESGLEGIGQAHGIGRRKMKIKRILD